MDFLYSTSYHDSASIADNKDENEERLRRSRYYRERTERAMDIQKRFTIHTLE
jgi:hypothetical protein